MKNGRLVQPAVESGLSIRRPGWSRRDGAGLRSAHRFLERLAGAEFRLPRRRQVDAFAGARVALRVRSPGTDEEAAETDDPHLVTAAQGLGDHAEHGLHGAFRLLLAESARIQHLSTQVLLVHAVALRNLLIRLSISA